MKLYCLRSNFKKGKVIFALVFALLFLFNVFYFAPKVFTNLHLRKFILTKNITFNNSDNQYFSTIRSMARNELIFPYVSPITDRESRKIQQYGFWWPTALVAHSLVESHEIYRHTEDIDYLRRFYDQFIDPDGVFYKQNIVQSVDNIMHGNQLVYLNQVNGDIRYKKAADYLYNSLQIYPRSKTGIFSYRTNKPELILVDTLGMICPFLANYGKTYDVPEVTEIALRQLMDFIANGVDPSTGLPYHGYISGSKGYMGILGWGRGTGWYLYGLIGVLEYLPSDHEHRDYLIMALEKIAQSLETFQKDNGSWSWSIINSSSGAEMSGTAMIAYSLEKAISLGFLPKHYHEMLDKAFNSLKLHTTAKGFVVTASGESGGPGRYSSQYSHYLWAQGPAVAFTSIHLKRKYRESDIGALSQ